MLCCQSGTVVSYLSPMSSPNSLSLGDLFSLFKECFLKRSVGCLAAVLLLSLICPLLFLQ